MIMFFPVRTHTSCMFLLAVIVSQGLVIQMLEKDHIDGISVILDLERKGITINDPVLSLLQYNMCCLIQLYAQQQ